MDAFNVAFARDQQSDMIIVPVEPFFADLCRSAQQRVLDRISQSAELSGFKGSVVAVWDQRGKLKFRAPLAVHRYLRTLTMADIQADLSARLEF